jgi:hypothetical protein
MAALSDYPKNGAVVRGDPLVIPVTITSDGDPVDASTSDWRAQVRNGFDAALVTEFTCTTAIPAGGTVASQVLMSMSGDETTKLKQGMVFDLEELDPGTGDTIRTWWICTGLRVQPDVSRDDPGPLPQALAQTQLLATANARRA